MVGLAFAIAASANFPALVLSIFWRRFTTAARQASMLVGTFVGAAADLPLAHDPGERPQARLGALPAQNPGLVTIPLSFLVGIVVSLLTPESDAAEGFDAMQHRLHLGPEADQV